MLRPLLKKNSLTGNSHLLATRSRAEFSSLTSLESALIRNACVNPLESALTKNASSNSFRIRTYEKSPGGTHVC
jgi:hypothetical protein